ncbi:MAG: D-alanine--D-alanine ligase [Candidatus Aminicenantes bacterium]|nr:D-alanine--D-alanine ligase [Candidatus Aminicenantes bacterium]
MKKKFKVALLFGGRSAEHEISILSARSIYNNLNKDRYRVLSVYINKDGLWKIVSSPHAPARELKTSPFYPFLPWNKFKGQPELEADVYFPVLHGPFGEDGTIQGLLEMAGVPYVGSGILASAVGMDKAVFKHVLSAINLPVVPFVVIQERDWIKNTKQMEKEIISRLEFPVFVKPANLGSSVGISKVKNRKHLAKAIELAFRYDRKILVEKGINGREIECSVLGNEEPMASLPGEVIPYREFYDYADKYLEGKTRFKIPVELPAEKTKEIQHLAVVAFKAIDACGLARVDFFLERETGQVYINEINTMPGFTEISMYPRLWEVSGMSFPALLDRLIELALERFQHKKFCVERF